MSAAHDYYEKTTALLAKLRETQMDAVARAAQICTDSIANRGLVFLFGAGHSRMMCEEMTPRQGGFVGFFALVEVAVSTHASIVGTEEAAALARNVEMGTVIPCHYEMFEFNTADPAEFVQACQSVNQDHRVLRCGERGHFQKGT